jgi:hypothetical protein
MVFPIWLVLTIWLPMIWFKLGSILEVLKEIRDILKKGGEADA